MTEITGSEDVAVTLEACHSCVTARGIKKTNTKTFTAELRGQFRTDPAMQFYLK
jgi:GTP cyclohydrolase I